MKKRMAIMLILAIIVFGGIVGFYFFKQAMIKKVFSNFAPPPATVSTAKVTRTTWKPFLTAIGNLKAEQSINVSPGIGGKVVKIYFKSGEYVQQGTPLVDLDASIQKAKLRADQANLKLQEISYQRNLSLYKRKALARSTLDSSLSTLEAAKAIVEGDQATIAKLQITAPFSGRLGIREVSIGQYVAPPPATGNIVPLSSIDPILIQFNMPQQDLPRLHLGQKISLRVDAYPGKVFHGMVTATNANVTSDSRTILVEATAANSEHILVPGMFVSVRIELPVMKNIIMVPQTAIVYSLYGNSVYVVNKNNKVMQKFVTLGQTEGNNVLIEKGVQAGETIVTSGQLKLRNGSSIKINNRVLPT